MKKNVLQDLQSKSANDFARFLSELLETNNTPWIEWFQENYCNKCESVIHPIIFGNREHAPCELGDNRCGFAELDEVSLIKLWLEHDVKDE